MISRFKKLIIIINFFILILQFSFCNLSAADEKKKQHCDIKTTLIKIIDTNGKLVEEKTEEKVVCDDSAKHFFQDAPRLSNRVFMR